MLSTCAFCGFVAAAITAIDDARASAWVCSDGFTLVRDGEMEGGWHRLVGNLGRPRAAESGLRKYEVAGTAVPRMPDEGEVYVDYPIKLDSRERELLFRPIGHIDGLPETVTCTRR